MKQVTATVGPYCGTVMHLPDDQADQALADKWAVSQAEPPFDLAIDPKDYPELTAAERATAEQAARAWWDAAHPTAARG